MKLWLVGFIIGIVLLVGACSNHIDEANTVPVNGQKCVMADIRWARKMIKPGVLYCPVGPLTTQAR